MKLRALGVALLASCGLALAVLPASVAAAVDDTPILDKPVAATGDLTGQVLDKPIFDDKTPSAPGPYPPSKDCGGPTGALSLGKFLANPGDAVSYSGCGYVPGATVTILRNGAAVAAVVADAAGNIAGTVPVTSTGDAIITASGEGVEKADLFQDTSAGTASVARVSTGTVDVVDPASVNGAVIPIPIPIPIGGDKCLDESWDGWDGLLGGDGRTPLADALDDRSKDGALDDGKKDGALDDGKKDGGLGDDKDKDRKDDGLDDKDCRDDGVGAGVGVAAVGVGVGGVGGATPAGGTLPFTGVETGAMASIALALLGGGVLLRVAARRRRNTLGAHTEG